MNQALLVTTTELLETWRRSSIPVKDRKNVKKCVQKQVDLWKLLKKHKNKETERKNHFISQLDTLLDISSAKVEEELLILFLNDQRNERRFNLCSINASVLKTKVEDYAAEDEATGGEEGEVVGGEEAEDAMAVDDVAGSLNYLSLINIIELLIIIIKKKTNILESYQDASRDDPDYIPEPKRAKITREGQSNQDSVDVLTEHVVSALDRNKISNRQAMKIIAPVAAAFGGKLAKMPLSCSTIRRKRKQCRQEIAERVTAEFEAAGPVVVHWDGVKLENISSSGHSGDSRPRSDVAGMSASCSGTDSCQSVFCMFWAYKISRDTAIQTFSREVARNI